jgi:hypothetical protein
MKFLITLIILINTFIFGTMAFYSYRTFKVTEENLQGIKSGIDSANVRLKNINAALDDKLYGIISSMPRR